MATDNNQSEGMRPGVETIVSMNKEGRITIPADVRSLLKL